MAGKFTRPKAKKAFAIGSLVGDILEKRLLPRQKQFGPIVEMWQQLLPEQLGQHCRLDSVHGGRLKVQVDSPSYLHELQICRDELLKQLQDGCPRARLRGIDFKISSWQD
ncbi:DUF721 domain-containing protein [Planctomycetota bacterium]